KLKDCGQASSYSTHPPSEAATPPVTGKETDRDPGHNFLAPPEGPDELGRLGPYRVLKLLGAGGMGLVFEAEGTARGRLGALKVLRPATLGAAAAEERFLREARAAAQLRHDHIVTVYQVGKDRGVPYLAMELLEGCSLAALLRDVPILPQEQVLRLG